MGSKSTKKPNPYSKYTKNGSIETIMIGENDSFHCDHDNYGYCIYNGTIKDIKDIKDIKEGFLYNDHDKYTINPQNNLRTREFNLNKSNVECTKILEELKTKKYVSFYYIGSTIISLNPVKNVITKTITIGNFSVFNKDCSLINHPKKFTIDMTDDDKFQYSNHIIINNDIISKMDIGGIYIVDMIELNSRLYEVTHFSGKEQQSLGISLSDTSNSNISLIATTTIN